MCKEGEGSLLPGWHFHLTVLGAPAKPAPAKAQRAKPKAKKAAQQKKKNQARAAGGSAQSG
jgi:hypothetical protein